MKNNKTKLLITEITLMILLILHLVFINKFNRIIFSIIIFMFMIIFTQLQKKQKIKSIYTKQINILMLSFALIYVVILYLLGLYFGFHKTAVKFSMWGVINYIIPYTLIIISMEYIRKSILCSEMKFKNTITIIIMILIEIILFVSANTINTLENLLSLVGFVLFASTANNILYNYIFINHGDIKNIIIYRIITTIYIYVMPIVPNIYAFLEALIRILYPYIIYILLDILYAKNTFVISIKDRRKQKIIAIILLIISTIIILLVSGVFKYGILVVGSGSMTGALNKGDIILYSRIENKEKLKSQEIIVFEKSNIKIIHRIIEIKEKNNEKIYYTKGDANTNMDDGYIYQNNIIGRVIGRIPYVGYLTLWLNDIFR